MKSTISKNKYNLEYFQQITKPILYSYANVPIASDTTTFETYKSKTDFESIEMDILDDIKIAIPITVIKDSTSNSSDFNQKELMTRDLKFYDFLNNIKTNLVILFFCQKVNFCGHRALAKNCQKKAS